MHDPSRQLPATAGQIWVRRDALSPWEVDFVVNEARDGNWVWCHDPTVTMTVSELTWADDDGVHFARPEIVLAHKAKWRHEKDDFDFGTTWPLLDGSAKSWLQTKVANMYPNHSWLPRMS